MPDLLERFQAAANRGIKRLTVLNREKETISEQERRDQIIQDWAGQCPEEFFALMDEWIREAQDGEHIAIESHPEMAKFIGMRLGLERVKDLFEKWVGQAEARNG